MSEVMLHVEYWLSPTGQKIALQRGLDAHQHQHLSGLVNPIVVDQPGITVDPDGEAWLRYQGLEQAGFKECVHALKDVDEPLTLAVAITRVIRAVGEVKQACEAAEQRLAEMADRADKLFAIGGLKSLDALPYTIVTPPHLRVVGDKASVDQVPLKMLACRDKVLRALQDEKDAEEHKARVAKAAELGRMQVAKALEEERRIKAAEDKEAADAAYLRTLHDWVREHGTDSQKARVAEHLLPRKEAEAAVRDWLFQSADRSFTRFDKVLARGMFHRPECKRAGDLEDKDLVVELVPPATVGLLATEHATWMALQSEFKPPVTGHTLEMKMRVVTPACGCPAVRRVSVLITIAYLDRAWSKEYSLDRVFR